MQAVLPFGRKEKVLNRQIRERSEGKKIQRGPGRPPLDNGRVPHSSRPRLAKKSALHVTLRVNRNVPNLRTRRRFNAIKHAFVRFCGSGKGRTQAAEGFRLVSFAVLANHVHFVVEADSKRALSMGMQKLLHSISRRLNALSVREHGGRVSTQGGDYAKLHGWLGRVFSDRYHSHLLSSPTEMVRAVRYVLQNAERHYGTGGGPAKDPFTSLAASDEQVPLVAKPKGYLLSRACRQAASST